jgi:hypothetical protein
MAHVPEEPRNFQKELDRLLEVLIEEEGAEAIKQIFGDFVYIEDIDGPRTTD